MSINKINYELYALDYQEGTLDGQRLAEMETFLDQHPDIREELEGMRWVVLSPNESVVYEGKEDLKRPVTASVGVFPLWGRVSAAAAILLLVWMFWNRWGTESAIPQPEIAKEEARPMPAPPTMPVLEEKSNSEKQPIQEEGIAVKPMAPPQRPKDKAPENTGVIMEETPQTTIPERAVAKQAVLPHPQGTLPSPKPTEPINKPTPDIPFDGGLVEHVGTIELPAIEKDSEVIAISFTEEPKDLVKLTPPSFETSMHKPPPPTVTARAQRLKNWGLLPDRTTRMRTNALREAFVPEAFSK
jgi:hypothetical protein